MILYNVTVSVDPGGHGVFQQWMKTKHIPDVLATGLFIENRFLRILSTEEGEAHTYSLQYVARSMEDYERYRQQFAPALQAEHTARYRDRFVAFRTLLEWV